MAKQDQQFQSRMARIETLIQEIEAEPDSTIQEQARELVQALLDLHGAAFERVLEVAGRSGAPGQAIVDDMARDELVSKLLILHGLHPSDLETRVRDALEKVRPFLATHGGNVELLGVSDTGTVRLRLQGSCHGCPSSRVTLKYAIEEGIYAAAPDVTALEVEGVADAEPAPPAGFVPLSQLAQSNLVCPTGVSGLTAVAHP